MNIKHSRIFQYNNNNANRKDSKKLDRQGKIPQHIPKLVQIQFAQFLNDLLEYANELTYFAINAFQTSSLRRVQINTLVKKNFIDQMHRIELQAILKRIITLKT